MDKVAAGTLVAVVPTQSDVMLRRAHVAHYYYCAVEVPVKVLLDYAVAHALEGVRAYATLEDALESPTDARVIELTASGEVVFDSGQG